MFNLNLPIDIFLHRADGHQGLGIQVAAFGPAQEEWTLGTLLSDFPSPGGPTALDPRSSILAAARAIPSPPAGPTTGEDFGAVAPAVAARTSARSRGFFTRGSYERADDMGVFLTDDGLEIYVPHQRDFETGEWIWMTALVLDAHADGVIASPIRISASEPLRAPNYGDGTRLGLIRSHVVARLAALCDWTEDPSIEEVVIAAHLAPASISNTDRDRARDFLAPHASATLDDYLGKWVHGYVKELTQAAKLMPPVTEGCVVRQPPARLVKTARDAEEYAAEFMVALGFSDAAVTPVGPDSGIDVTASGAVAQVKMEGLPTGRPAVQRIAGAAANKGVDALFFSLAGYTSQAVEWADDANVALFEFAFDGTVEPRSRGAHRLLSRNQTAPRNWYADPLERFEYRWWDGDTWTAHVATRGVPQTDPLGIAVE